VDAVVTLYFAGKSGKNCVRARSAVDRASLVAIASVVPYSRCETASSSVVQTIVPSLIPKDKFSHTRNSRRGRVRWRGKTICITGSSGRWGNFGRRRGVAKAELFQQASATPQAGRMAGAVVTPRGRK